MIRGIGIDSIEIDRVSDWYKFADKQLAKIFSAEEIAFCRQLPLKAAERFAVRFAAREAFFKALSQLNSDGTLPFLSICKLVYIERNAQGACSIKVTWDKIIKPHTKTKFQAHLSMSHDRNKAIAFVVIEEI